jgi:hypothetical protein
MSKATICDRCGKLLVNTADVYNLSLSGQIGLDGIQVNRQYDLCGECAKKIAGAYKPDEEEEEA